jgi:flagellar secretion chaperone FliS
MNLESPANAYLRTKVLTASPEQLRLMLLEGAIKFARQGREGLAAGNYEVSFTGISQCRDIIMELLTTMKSEVDPELCGRLRSLYTFMYSQLVSASMERDTAKLDAVIGLLEFERETWVMLMEKLTSERSAESDAVCREGAGAERGARPALSIQG